MVIPKQFEGLQDLEAMLLTSILGVFISLKEDLISIQQAESYWLSDFTADLFEEMKLSKEVITLLQEGCQLKDYKPISKIYNEKLDNLIKSSKELIAKYYTEYDEYEEDEAEIAVEINNSTIVN